MLKSGCDKCRTGKYTRSCVSKNLKFTWHLQPTTLTFFDGQLGPYDGISVGSLSCIFEKNDWSQTFLGDVERLIESHEHPLDNYVVLTSYNYCDLPSCSSI